MPQRIIIFLRTLARGNSNQLYLGLPFFIFLSLGLAFFLVVAYAEPVVHSYPAK